jgi:hypothetical protein
MAWLVMSLTVRGYAARDGEPEKVKRERPWCELKSGHTFTNMLEALCLELLRERFLGTSGDAIDDREALERLIQWAAAVR